MGYPVSISLPGSLTGYVDVDVLVGPFSTAQTITQFSPSLIDAPVGGSVDVSVRNAASGAGDSIDASFAAGEYNASVTGSIDISAGGYAYIRVTAESGGALTLGGFFLVESAAPVVDIANEPLTLGEVKQHLNIATGITDHDTDLGNMIARVREEAETLTGLPIVSQSKTITLDEFPSGGDLEWWDGVRNGMVGSEEVRAIQLPAGNLQSVTSVTTYDDSDNATVLSSSNYFVDTVKNRIVLRSGQTWPTVNRVAGGIVIVAVMGWATPSAVPGDLKERMKERIAQRFRARGDSTAEGLRISSSFYGPWVRRNIGRRNL